MRSVRKKREGALESRRGKAAWVRSLPGDVSYLRGLIRHWTLRRLDDRKYGVVSYLRGLIRYWTLRRLDDREYAERRFFGMFGSSLDLSNPRTLVEKLQWLKLCDRRPILQQLSDKYEVRQYVRDNVGERYLNRLFGVYDNVGALRSDLRRLPESLIIKATHGCGWNLLVRDKETIRRADWKKMKTWLATEYYPFTREWCYKGIRPRLICERLIEPRDPIRGVVDYKFFCFNGRPRIISVVTHRHTGLRETWYDVSWNRIPVDVGWKPADEEMSKPRSLDELADIATRLSAGLPFVRVDLYCESEILFGEMTFCPHSGFMRFNPSGFDREFGDWLQLPLGGDASGG